MMMPNLAPALIPSLSPAKHGAEKHFLGKVVLRVRQRIRDNQALNELHKLDERDLDDILGELVLRARQQIRYHRALQELRKLDDRDLDDINIARADFPELAWRHATGAEPLARWRGGS
jgi:uncharacterized protein YjiS (DUF1127 family)